jgi:predicted O-methyltransferase YrrM
MSDLVVLIPTRGRPENLRKVIAAWDFTNAWDVADMVVIADADDPEIDAYRRVAADTEHPDTGEALVKLIEMATWMPMVYKLNAVAAEIASGTGTFIPVPPFALGFAGDDHLPQTIGWAQRYLTVLGELGTGMVYSDDGYQGAKLSTEWAVTSDVVRALSRMVPADVEHMYCDNSIMEMFAAAGALRFLPEVRVEHMHPVAGKAENDEQYRRVNGTEQFARDRRGYEQWQRGQKPFHVAAIRKIRGNRPDVDPPKAVKTTEKKRSRGVSRMPFPHHFKRVKGATPPEIEVTLADFAMRVPADQEIVELGVYQGRTAIIMAWGAKQGGGAHVTAIDPWDLPGNSYDPPFTDDASHRWASYNVSSLAMSNHVTLLQDFSVTAAATWTGKPIGLLFVDGDHSEEGARDDILSWAPYLADGAIIAVDDYYHPDWPGVAAAIDDLVTQGVLAPVAVYHDRLAVTRLAVPGDESPTENLGPASLPATAAITSEGVSPPPEPVMNATELSPLGQEPMATQPLSWQGEDAALLADIPEPSEDAPADPDSEVSDPGVVAEGELPKIAAGSVVRLLSISQLRALAKARDIELGTRGTKGDPTTKRAEILDALGVAE